VNRPRIAIVGAGIGGLTLAGSLHRLGFAPRVYEQADCFSPVGAGIQLTPNAVKALLPLGLGDDLRRVSFAPAQGLNRDASTGEITNALAMGEAIEHRYGAPDLALHRSRLHSVLASLVPESVISFGRKLTSLQRTANCVRMTFADGSIEEADLVVGADGLHSAVRRNLFGDEAPRYTGKVAYRSVLPTSTVRHENIDERAKWWGKDRHVVTYFTKPERDEIYFIAVCPEPDYTVESWSNEGRLDELMSEFASFHPQIRAVLAAAQNLRKWALLDRDPLPSWDDAGIILLGDACHPMPPFIAQGSASAIEDAIILARILESADDLEAASRRFVAARRPRTSKMQMTARDNTWLRLPTATDWVYDYDAWRVDLPSDPGP
jgi:6-hydroxynicotinate 3-monooxygenase